jgi:hypothetical protein
VKPFPHARARGRILVGVRGALTLGALAGALCLVLPAAAYVVPSDRVIERWVRSRGAAAGPVELAVAWGERQGVLYVAGPGRHALALDGHPTQFDPGPGEPHPLAHLWRAADLFAVTSASELEAILEASGLDLRRAGYARSLRSDDGVALTVGARGEGEPSLPQVHFSRSPLRPSMVRLSAWAELGVGGLGPHGWPEWFDLGETGLLRVVAPPRPSPWPPPWAARSLAPLPQAPDLLAPPGWRRNFGGVPP